MEYKKFNAINVSSKIAICGLPLRIDSYKTCTFNCRYCFSNNRKIMEFNKELQVANINQFEKTLKRVHIDKNIKENSLVDNLLNEDITLHWGGMSDPFQPIEKKLGVTKQLIDISNKYNKHILFSTKSDTTYDCDIRPDLHSFQLSFTSSKTNNELEPNVPSFENRVKFYKELKSKGFKVGIRIQPFIPGITDVELIEIFKDADYFTIEGLKLVPQNKEQKQFVYDYLGLSPELFTQKGLLNLKEEVRTNLYQEFIEKLNYYNIPFSIADNDMRAITSSKCCCGEPLVRKSTDFNTTAMIFNYCEYDLDDVVKSCPDAIMKSKASQLFTSNRTEGCVTLREFYDKRFDRKSSPFPPKFQVI